MAHGVNQQLAEQDDYHNGGALLLHLRQERCGWQRNQQVISIGLQREDYAATRKTVDGSR